jgi:hypothetical protein
MLNLPQYIQSSIPNVKTSSPFETKLQQFRFSCIQAPSREMNLNELGTDAAAIEIWLRIFIAATSSFSPALREPMLFHVQI